MKIGDAVRVRAGEKVPLDGVILDGETTVKTAVGAAGMAGAMIADVGVLILAVLNALRCMRV